jgi:hypothetical protein
MRQGFTIPGRTQAAHPFSFRISDFGFRICRPQAVSSNWNLQSACGYRAGLRREGRAMSHLWAPGCVRNAERFQHRRQTTISLETNDHSLPSESRGGPGPTWLSEGGWAGGGGGKGVRGRPSARIQPAGAPQARSVGGWRDRRALALGGHAIRERVAAGEDRGRRASGHGDGC